MTTLDTNEVMKVVADGFQKAADTLKAHFDKKDPVLLTEETARKIWDAAVKWVDFLENGGPHGDDFETFYKTLIEGK